MTHCQKIHTNLSIQFINHASIIISNSDISLLSDPWYEGAAFNNGWNLLYENDATSIENMLNQVTHIWISHEHPDHFSIAFFKQYGEFIKDTVEILFQKTRDQRVVKFLRANNFKVIELEFNRPHVLSHNFSVTCIKDGFYDSGLLSVVDGKRILNLNDCEVTTLPRAKEVHQLTGDIDVLLTQFSYAAWKGNPENISWRQEAATEKLNTIKLQISIFKPKFLIPFASFISFSNQDNAHLNQGANTLLDVDNSLSSEDVNLIFMKPSDIFTFDNEHWDNNLAIDFWREQQDIKVLKWHSYETVGIQTLNENFQKYIARIVKNNDHNLIKFLAKIPILNVFKPVRIYLTDLATGVEVNLTNMKLKSVDSSFHISMHSNSFNFLMNNSFGFDTLTVNGCFREENKGGFVLATKTLAIENLNNLGISVSWRSALNLKLIGLFFMRLYRVARKLDT